MKCERRDLAIAKLAGGDLPPWRANRLQRHVDACPRCKALHDDLVQRRAAVRTEFAEPPATIVDVVLNRVEQEGPVAARSAFARRAIAGAAVVAILLVTAAVAVIGFSAPETAQDIQTAAVTSGAAQAPEANAQTSARSDVVIKLVTDKPNVAIYWLGDSAGGM